MTYALTYTPIRLLTTDFGGENSSDRKRVQLSVTFRNPGAENDRDVDSDEGFTYELREDLAGRFKLGDFLPSSSFPTSESLFVDR